MDNTTTMTTASKERLWQIFKDTRMPKDILASIHDDKLKEIFLSEFIQFQEWFELRQETRRLLKAIFKVLRIKQIVGFIDKLIARS